MIDSLYKGNELLLQESVEKDVYIQKQVAEATELFENIEINPILGSIDEHLYFRKPQNRERLGLFLVDVSDKYD